MADQIPLLEALKAASEIMKAVKRSEDSQDRANLKLAFKKLKQLKRQLRKKGWEDWEKDIYNDLVKAYSGQLKKLMNK